MDYIVDQNELTVETIATHSEYLKTVASSESSLTCPMMIEKLKDEAIHLNIFEDCKKVGRKCILTEKHKMTVINFIDTNPSATVVKVTEHLSKQFNDLKVSRSIVYNFMINKCNLH
ncbi:hypothetical protein RO3G_11471 [Rhizopus delemar RA 99-880]|uniref:Uncharacterized protein n=1 Tax=Rhizopus delemar (strain RA 99-880 / ATCC MYA-4621 / FGSC 9543 / NRRL 43880) TaxID=246409 RepID=I1CE80_RHIO9|nr:hypothetical protein RO3G_11471 [Rhizopus delemar RA 99-880]|eukprot:EIE86760.1 hypothetical protein RO3G_11471 [Rhizopus delemar RA 99-880]